MKLLKTVLVTFLLIAAIVVLMKNTIVKIGVEKGVEVVTGLEMNIRSLNIGITKTLVSINDLKLYNPKGYKDPIMLDMEEIYVDYNLPSILSGTVHLEEMRIALKEFVVVKNEKGELNLNSLNVVKDEQRADKPRAPEPAVKKGKAPSIRIDKLRLSVGKVYYKDYSKGGAPTVKEYNLNINEEFTDITDPDKLVSLLVVKALMGTPIAQLAGFDLGGLQGTVTDTLAGARKISMDVLSQAGGSLAKTAENPQDAVKETAETLKKTAEDITKAIKLPFGGGTEE